MMAVHTLRTRILIGLLPTLVILTVLGLWAVGMFYRLGGNIDRILRENYRSVLAAQGMKEAVERMDSGLLFVIAGQHERGRRQYAEHRARFLDQLRIEQGNITLPGEQELADNLARWFERYTDAAGRFLELPAGTRPARIDAYFHELLPAFDAIREGANAVLQLNQDNMSAMDLQARENAALSTRLMAGALIAAIAMAVGISVWLSRSIERPIRAVTVAARAVARGELDQVIASSRRDELGELSIAFNRMARTIREFRQAGTARLLRAQKTAQATIDAFPDPMIVVDPMGSVELANPAARRLLGAVPAGDTPVPWQPPAQIRTALSEVLAGRGDHLPPTLEQAIPLSDGAQERFFLPRVVAIRADDELLGAAVNMVDVTRFHRLDRLKSDMVSTVSHELKTPLTSVQMAVHLLLEEVVGPLNSKQIELLLAARHDADRILAMIDDLLDLSRIEQGRVRMNLQPESVATLIAEAEARMDPQAEDAGIGLSADRIDHDLAVLVDRDRIHHVFDNLIGNAIQHTPRGGAIRLSARVEGPDIAVEVHDTGRGIPAEHLPHLFDKFYRVPGQATAGGAGLGLAIAREVIAAHGGRIEVDSQPGRGTTFTFSLPACPAAAGSDGPEGQLRCPSIPVS